MLSLELSSNNELNCFRIGPPAKYKGFMVQAVMTTPSPAVASLKPLAAATGGTAAFNPKEKPTQVRASNMAAARAVADVVKTSLGPRGMDKMIQNGKGQVIVTNDGATILKNLQVLHPAARMMVELSEAQDSAAGDGTTSVVVMAGALLAAAESALAKGIHPTTISESFRTAVERASEFVETEMGLPVDTKNKDALVKCALTSLSSKVVSSSGPHIAGLAAQAILTAAAGTTDGSFELDDIRVVPRLGGTLEDMRLIEGLVLPRAVNKSAGGPNRMDKARIGLIQFQLSPPKTDMESNIVVADYQQMDRILREERAYILDLCKRIKKTGCNVLLVQKSILRDAVSEMARHYLAKLKILLVEDIERDQIEYLARVLHCRPVADIDSFAEERLASADLVEEVEDEGAAFIQVIGLPKAAASQAVSVLVRGANQVVLEEAERSLHDALCALKSLLRKPLMIVGGGAAEAHIAVRLAQYAQTVSGASAFCLAAYAEALEVIPCILAENAGQFPVPVLAELKKRHAAGDVHAGISVRRAAVSDMREEGVFQPAFVTLSALQLATETVCMILKIDDIVEGR